MTRGSTNGSHRCPRVTASVGSTRRWSSGAPCCPGRRPALALLGFGKRDVPFDIDLPMPQIVRSPEGDTREAEGLLTIVELNDQHAYARVDAGLTIDVGDRVRCGLSHPCTAFDKWRHIPVLDDDDRVIDAVATFF